MFLLCLEIGLNNRDQLDTCVCVHFLKPLKPIEKSIFPDPSCINLRNALKKEAAEVISFPTLCFNCTRMKIPTGGFLAIALLLLLGFAALLTINVSRRSEWLKLNWTVSSQHLKSGQMKARRRWASMSLCWGGGWAFHCFKTSTARIFPGQT